MNKTRKPPQVSEEAEAKNQMISLVGYSAKERFTELKSSYTIKNKNFEKRKADDGEIKKMLDDVVAMLKNENKKLKVMMRYMDKTKRQQQFLELFTDKEQKLKYSHKSAEDIEDILNCRLGHKRNIQNLLLYRQKKVKELMKEMENEIKYLDGLSTSGGYDAQLVDTIRNLQSDIESIEDKCRVNSYIRMHYLPIVSLLDKEISIFPIRIKNAEIAFKHNTQELQEVKDMHAEAKEAKHLAIQHMWKLQEDVDADRRARGEVVLAVRKNMAHRYEALEKLKKRKTNSEVQCEEGGSDLFDQTMSMLPVLREMRLAHYQINDLFGSIKSTLLETRIMTACETMLNNDEMNEAQARRKRMVDDKFKSMQSKIKQNTLIKVKMVQTISNKREECRLATEELEEKIKAAEIQIEEKKKKLTIDGDLLMTVKKGIHAIGSKLRWLSVDGFKEGDSIEAHIFNITARLNKLKQMYNQKVTDEDAHQIRQEFCLSRLVRKNIVIQFSEEDTQKAGALAAFDEVMELNDNTPMVRNYMKTASKRLVAKQKRVMGRR